MTADELVEKIEALLSDVTPGEWATAHGIWVYGVNGGDVADCDMLTERDPSNAAYLVAVQPQNIALLLSDRASSAARIAEMEKALKDIAESDDIENALDPARNKRVAIQALAALAALGGRSDG